MRRKSSQRPNSQRPKVRPSKPGVLHYKVVELSTVDESSLERAINPWVAQGWSLDGVQFAMRESSKRPSMAFVFLTRDGPAEVGVPRDRAVEARAVRRLAALAGVGAAGEGVDEDEDDKASAGRGRDRA